MSVDERFKMRNVNLFQFDNLHRTSSVNQEENKHQRCKKPGDQKV